MSGGVGKENLAPHLLFGTDFITTYSSTKILVVYQLVLRGLGKVLLFKKSHSVGMRVLCRCYARAERKGIYLE